MHDVEPLSYPLHAIKKKDIFTSRGWGAAGMPYSLYYISKPFSQPRPTGQPALAGGMPESIAPNGSYDDHSQMEGENFDALRIAEALDQKTKNEKNSKYVIPQLFVSYGWGPMG